VVLDPVNGGTVRETPAKLFGIERFAFAKNQRENLDAQRVAASLVAHHLENIVTHLAAKSREGPRRRADNDCGDAALGGHPVPSRGHLERPCVAVLSCLGRLT
jgi:hypothetical protein